MTAEFDKLLNVIEYRFHIQGANGNWDTWLIYEFERYEADQYYISIKEFITDTNVYSIILTNEEAEIWRENYHGGYLKDVHDDKKCLIKSSNVFSTPLLHLDICLRLNQLYERKNADYGDSFHKSFEEYGLIMSCIRLEDKLNRFKRLTTSNDQKVKDESIKDTLMDLANYAIMTLIELDF